MAAYHAITERKYPITNSFAAHKKRGATNLGVDYGHPLNTKLFAPCKMRVTAKKDQFGGIYAHCVQTVDMKLKKRVIPKGTVWQFVHLNKVSNIKLWQTKDKNKGQLIGLTGSTGKSTGPHTHITIISKGRHIDPAPIINEIHNQWTKKMKETTVAQKLKKQIAEHNEQLEKAKQEISEIVERETEGLQSEIAELKEQVAIKQASLDEIFSTNVVEGFVKYEDLYTPLLEKQSDDMIDRWGLFVDSLEIPKTFKSLLKYELFVVLGAGASYVVLNPLVLSPLNLSPEMTAAAISVCGIIFKLLVTRYDKNKDGVLDSKDFENLG